MTQPKKSQNTIEFELLIESYKKKCHKDLFLDLHSELEEILKK